MHPPSLKTAVRRIRSLAEPPAGPADADLLARFRAGDDRAFAAIVARHGAAVLGTCRRILADPHAADDAFQATFLVLARRPGSVRKAAALGCWLHGVAVRVSMKLRGRLARAPRSVATVDVPTDPRDEVLWRDVRRVLDEELNRLPERLRLPVYMCYYEGKTRDEAADALGWKVTTLRGRLEDGRQRLRTRLTRRGIELSAALLAVSAGADGFAVGDALLESTVRAAGGAATLVVRELARGVVVSAALGKATLTTGAVLLALGLGAMLLGYRGEAGGAPGPAPKDPPPAAKPDPVRELLALMQAADRVWVVDPPTDDRPVPEPVEVLKGMTPPDARYAFKFNVEALKDLPRKGHRWVVFLKCVEETDRQTTVPLAGDKWFVPADDVTLPALRQYVPACAWGEASNGLRLGLHARPAADEPAVEVVLQNVGTRNLTIAQLGVPTFDDWPHLTIEVTGPDGKARRLERHGKPYKDSPPPVERVLKAGEQYIHVVRPGRWTIPPDGGRGGNAPPDLFAVGGDFKLEATYQLTDGRDEPRWWIGKLTAGPVMVAVPAAAAYGDPAGDFRVRLRPVGPLRVGEAPELVLDVRHGGKAKRSVIRDANLVEIEVDGTWFTNMLDPRGTIWTDDLAAGADRPAWLTARPDANWTHLRDKPGAAGDPGEAIKELVPFRLTPGNHTVRVAYRFGRDERAVSNAVAVAVAPDGWGDPAGGVRARLRLDKTKFKPGDPLGFELDLRSLGRKTWKLTAIPFACEVFIDEVRYTYGGALDYKAPLKELKPGGELVPFVAGTVDAEWKAGRAPDVRDAERYNPVPMLVPFRLAPGKHTVRVAFPLDDSKLQAVSNPVEIDVETPPLDDATRAMVLGADRIWVVPSPTREKPVPEPVAVLKGPLEGNPGVFDLRLLPADDPKARWVVFLQADEDGKPKPEVKVLPWAQWSRPYTPELAAAVRQTVRPTDWGPEAGGLRLGLRLRRADVPAGEPIVAELTIGNVGANAMTVEQLRRNVHDSWPRTRFDVTDPAGRKWVLERPDGELKKDDSLAETPLKPGQTYTHAIRLDRWAVRPADGSKNGARPPANVFAAPGDYTITARHSSAAPVTADAWAVARGSNPVKLTVRDAAKEPAWGDAVNGFRARMRLAKSKFGPDEPLTFVLDLKNDGTEFRRVEVGEHRCWFILDGYKLPLDGLRYYYAGPPGPSAESKDLPPQAEERGFLTVTPDERWVRKNPGLFEFPYRRPVGKHILAVEYQADDKTRVTTRPVEFEAADDCGDPVGGVAARLRMKKKFGADESPTFELDLKHTGAKAYDVPVNPDRCELHLDGVTYTHADRLGSRAPDVTLDPGADMLWVRGDLGGDWSPVVGGRPGKPGSLPLGPGKHRLRVAYPVADGVKPLTREVEFEVAADEWGTASGGIRARLRVRNPRLAPGERLLLDLDLRNDRSADRTVVAADARCDLTLDGRPYHHPGPGGAPLPTKLKANAGPVWFLTVSVNEGWVEFADARAPFRLTPGRHTLSASYPVDDKTRVVTKSVEFEVAASDEWGPATGGIRARVRLAKARFQAGERLAFELDLKNVGDQTVEDGPIPMHCRIDLDGAEYLYTAPISYPISIQKLTPGKEFVPWVKVETNEWWTHVRDQVAVPLALTPGKHKLRVTYPLPGGRKPVSSTIEFEVVDEAGKAPDLSALAAAADRVVVAKIDWVGGMPTLTTTRTLKGPTTRWPTTGQPIDVPRGADLLPGERPADPLPGERRAAGTWILFLKAEEDRTEHPRLTPAIARGWYRLATDPAVEAVVAALPRPAEVGTAANGLTLALRPTSTAVRVGEDVRLEVILSNTSDRAIRVLQHRYGGYDYWPFLTFAVTGSDGQSVTLRRSEGAFKREDFIDEVELKPGERYVHAVRVNLWPAVLARVRTDLVGHSPFARPGTYTVRATYKAPTGFTNLSPDMVIKKWPFWAGEITSNPVTVEVKPAVGAERRKAFDDQPGRLQLTLLRWGDRTPRDQFEAALHLHATETATALPAARAEPIVVGEASKLIAALAADGFFERASEGGKPHEVAKGFRLDVTAGGDPRTRLWLDYPWTEETVRRLMKLAPCLNGNRPDAVQEVLAPLADTVPAWGEAVSGLASRLHVPDPTSPTTLVLEVRDRGTLGIQYVDHAAWCEVEVDGVWYEYSLKPVDYLSSELKPGSEPRRLALTLDGMWVGKGTKAALDLKPGKHTVRAAHLFNPPGPREGDPARAISQSVEIDVPKSPFDLVRRSAEPGQAPQLYLMLTEPGADLAALAGFVVKHAGAALAEADRQQFATGNVVFLVREGVGHDQGSVSGFSREQLAEIKTAGPAEARRLAERHAWSLGKLPAEKRP